MRGTIIVIALVLCAVGIYKFGITYTTESAQDFLVVSTEEDDGWELIEILQAYAKENGYVFSGYRLDKESSVIVYSVRPSNGGDLLTLTSHQHGTYVLSFYQRDGVYIKDDFMGFMKDAAKFKYELKKSL
ncbi:hypothetical protein [Burkholderia aenigmatica]|uniref:hypothetical protein n=1 Tax=Burkholderia aenigmatica TaxID=2015348 RepID=UPI00264E768A|nr:hypothetical protein [Burkholderia aenigmatica]MDN7876819.1 hypothetical protein [Burkholderia aenigmatica]